jgi:hypothetical protein
MLRRLAPALGLCLACTLPNPAFEDGDSLGEDADTATTDASASSTDASASSTAASSTDMSSTDASSTDASSTDMSSTDESGPLPDLPARPCMVELTAPLTPLFGKADQFGGGCPPTTTVTVKIAGPGPLPGTMMGSLCPGCSGECAGTQYVFGSVGLTTFADPLLAQAAMVKTCVDVQALAPLGEDEGGRCLYSSMWIGLGEQTRMLAVHGTNPPLPPGGELLLEGKPTPVAGQMEIECECGMLGLSDADLICCDEAPVAPHFHSLAFLDLDLMPGNAGDVVLGSNHYTFHAAQAQEIGTCTNPSAAFELSWALVPVL